MSESKTEVSSERRRFSEEFKQDAVRLVVSEEFPFKAAAVGERTCAQCPDPNTCSSRRIIRSVWSLMSCSLPSIA